MAWWWRLECRRAVFLACCRSVGEFLSRFGGDNLNVVQNVSRLIDGFVCPRSLELKEDGHLLAYIRSVLELRVRRL